jgi:hypothetical protein
MKNLIKNLSAQKFGYYVKKITAITEGKIRKNGVKAYWWDFVPNAGDLITPVLLRHYGLTPIHTWKDYAEVLSCGSILQNLPDEFSGTIIGSGILNPSVSVNLNNATILALRGEMTRDHIGASKETPLGDPGLLADKLLSKKQKKRYVAGIAPHFSDKNNPKILDLYKRYSKDLHVIDIQQDPIKVIEQIDQCEVILSTALHGLVFADALDIPNVWIVLADSLLPSKAFKYLDYNTALNREQTPYLLTGQEKLTSLIKHANKPAQNNLKSTKKRLDSVFRQFSEEVRAGCVR